MLQMLLNGSGDLNLCPTQSPETGSFFLLQNPEGFPLALRSHSRFAHPYLGFAQPSLVSPGAWGKNHKFGRQEARYRSFVENGVINHLLERTHSRIPQTWVHRYICPQAYYVLPAPKMSEACLVSSLLGLECQAGHLSAFSLLLLNTLRICPLLPGRVSGWSGATQTFSVHLNDHISERALREDSQTPSCRVSG